MRPNQHDRQCHRCCYLLLGLLLWHVCPAMGHADAGLEAKLKTAYLVNIARFTTWPNQYGPKVLCIMKDAAIFSEVQQLQAHEFGADLQLSIVINPTSLALCSMLYWDQSSADQYQQLLTTRHNGLLIVSDLSDAHQQGFAIQFFVRNLKLRLSIDQQALKGADYKISSKLLRLSKQID